MAAAIWATNCTNMTFTDVVVVGRDVAFDFSDSDGIKMENVHCQSTRVAVSGERVRGLQASNVTHNQSGGFPQLTVLTMIIRRAAYGYV